MGRIKATRRHAPTNITLDFLKDCKLVWAKIGFVIRTIL